VIQSLNVLSKYSQRKSKMKFMESITRKQ